MGEMRRVLPNDVKRGFRYRDRIGEIRVMAVADGYAMCRRPGAVPFIKMVAEVVLAATAGGPQT